jgi:hypothetical protein
LSERQSGSDGDNATLNAVAEEAISTQMLTASATSADPRLLTHDLGDQSFDIVRPRKIVAVATMITEDKVAIAKLIPNSNSTPFLTKAGMDSAKEFATREQIEQSFFHTANEDRLSRQPRKLIR